MDSIFFHACISCVMKRNVLLVWDGCVGLLKLFGDMVIELSKTDYNALLELTEKCVLIVQNNSTSNRERNAARRLRLLMKKVARKAMDGRVCEQGL